MQLITSLWIAGVLFISAAGCATAPTKPVTDEQFQHKEAMQDLDKNLDKEEAKKKETE